MPPLPEWTYPTLPCPPGLQMTDGPGLLTQLPPPVPAERPADPALSAVLPESPARRATPAAAANQTPWKAAATPLRPQPVLPLAHRPQQPASLPAPAPGRPQQ